MRKHRLDRLKEACASTLLEVEAALDLLGLHMKVHEVAAEGYVHEEY